MKSFFLPGMGGDSTMYEGPWRTIPGLRFVDWPVYRGERTLRDVALRILDRETITADDVVGGTSLGGIVAVEMAKILGSRAVLLIASAVCREEIRPSLRKLIPAARWFPFSVTQHVASLCNSHVSRMYRRTDPRFLRAMCFAIGEWEGMSDLSAPIYRLHGAHDRVITRVLTDAERILGGHLIVMTHADETSRWTRRILKSIESGQ